MTHAHIVADHHGGVLLAFNAVTDVYEKTLFESVTTGAAVVHRIDGEGNTVFGLELSRPGTNGIGVRITPNDEDRWLVVWREGRQEVLESWAQTVDLAGKSPWSEPFFLGPRECTSSVPDGQGGFVLVCQGWLLRIDRDGRSVWSGPVQLPGTDRPYYIEHGDGEGGVVYPTYVKFPVPDHPNTANTMIAIQHVTSNGKPYYSPEGNPITGSDRRFNTATPMAWVGAGALGLVITEGWDARLGPSPTPPGHADPVDYYAARFDVHGDLTWPSKQLIHLAKDTEGNLSHLPMIGDGEGGMVFAWPDDRDGDGTEECYAQRVLGDGSLVWAAGGRRLDTEAGHLCSTKDFWPYMVFEGYLLPMSGGFAVLYRVKDRASSWLEVQRFDWSLSPMWPKPVVLATCDRSLQLEPNNIVTDDNGGMWVQWEETPTLQVRKNSVYGYALRRIKLQRINDAGIPYFNASTR